ncbi:unnamed protein product [Symbiodinium sp. CCMP2592]|nr:unnamed protein product [Symbiodinium sp. CCMP2592]
MKMLGLSCNRQTDGQPPRQQHNSVVRVFAPTTWSRRPSSESMFAKEIVPSLNVGVILHTSRDLPREEDACKSFVGSVFRTAETEKASEGHLQQQLGTHLDCRIFTKKV